jgi:F-type H+-transporting ATPase subunit delta
MPKNDGGKAVAFVYARALFDVAVEAGIISQVERELLAIDEALDSDDRLERFFETPTIRFEEKRKVLLETMAGASKPLVNFLLLVIEHERVGLFDTIVDLFHELANTRAGVAEFELRSAQPLEAEALESLKSVLRRKLQREIVVHETSSPEILGGIILRHKDMTWDSSLVHRLGRMVDRIQAGKSELTVVWSKE